MKHVTHEYRASRRRSLRKLDNFEIRFTLFANTCICICGSLTLHLALDRYSLSDSRLICMEEKYECNFLQLEIVSECDQEIPESQNADKPMTPRERAIEPSLDTRKTNQAKQPAVSSPSG